MSLIAVRNVNNTKQTIFQGMPNQSTRIQSLKDLEKNGWIRWFVGFLHSPVNQNFEKAIYVNIT